MFEKPAELRKLFEQRAAEIAASSDLEQLRIEFLGKKGHVSGLMQELRNVPNDRKKEAGQRINETKQFIENALAQKLEELKKLEEQRLIESAESYDESMPVYTELGSYHPITLVQRELEDIFLNMGFSIEDYSEVTDDYTIMAMVEEGLGVSMLYRRTVEGMRADIRVRPIVHAPSRDVVAAWRSWDTMPIATRRFIDYMSSHIVN